MTHATLDSPVLSSHEVTVTFLEQDTRERMPRIPRPAQPGAILRAEGMPPSFYRYLFDAVGGPHKWVSRRYLSDSELAAIIHDDKAQIFVLYRDGWPAGFAELNTGHALGTEIKFFGLLPEAQGLGLGRWFFHEVAQLAWDGGASKLVIETCTLDNPHALRIYQRMGFSVYDQGKGLVEWRG